MLTMRRKQDAPPAPVGSPPSILGRSLVVRGHLESSGEIEVCGQVLGTVNAKRLVLASSGYIEGDVIAQDVLLSGTLNGRVFAVNVTVTASAIVTGRIFHHTATVAKEAKIDGRMPWRPVNFFETLQGLPKE